ncbi:MAG: HAMP domain-containing histidine kinase [Bacteroidales bacterium]|nr:HAMP domain-containing histidine kinase [Bacteroidales bacterium]
MNEIKGCAFICNENGTITHVFKDDFEMIPSDISIMFTSLIKPESVSSALNMLTEVRQNKVAFDYRLRLKYNEEFDDLYFMCMEIGGEFLVIGADNHHEAIELSEQLKAINNEQSNQIRKLIKQMVKEDSKESEEIFDEISKLNNELVNTQRELNKKNVQLHKLNEIKNRFISMAAHDLRNPLNSIMLYSEMVECEAADLSDSQKQFLKVINDSASFMLSLVDDLLEYGKIESGQVELNIREFDLCKAIQKTISVLQHRASEKKIEIVFNSISDQCVLQADDMKIEQVLQNLIGNAIKFSFENTKIIVTLIEEKSKIKLSIENTGIGIPPDKIDTIFKPFTKQSNGTGEEKGTGLGLFIVKRILDAHKASIITESVPNENTIFTVHFSKNLNT